MANTVDTNLVTSSVVPHLNRSRSGRREFSRLLWKELLALRTFAGLLAAVLSVTCGVLWTWRPEISEEASLLLLSLPQLVAIVFAIGSGALLFSQEDEAGTLDFLRGMGVSPRRLVNAKLTAGLVCMILLVGGSAAIGWHPPLAVEMSEMSTGKVGISVMSCGAGLVVLLWTSLWSMAIRRELPTLCCGLLGALLLKPFVERWDETGLLVLFGVLASGLWLLCQMAGSRWMGTGGWWWRTNGRTTALEAAQELARDDANDLPNLPVSERRAVSNAAGMMIAVGIVLWLLLLMMWRPQSWPTRGWAETLEIVWSMILGSVFGWLPVRRELRETRVPNRTIIGDWRQVLATGPIPWLLLWWLLSLGLMYAYRSDISLAALSRILRFFWDEVLPWTVLAFGSFRLLARLCSGGWLAWPLSVLPLGVGWCAWWLLVMLGEPAWVGLLIITAVFGSASFWHWRAAQRGRPVRRTNLYVTGGVIGSLVLLWGLLNWWRVAEIPQDWVGATKPTPLPALSAAEARELTEQRAEFSLVATIQPAPRLQWTDGREDACYHWDWGVVEGSRLWSDVTEVTRQWVEQNTDAIESSMRWSSMLRAQSDVKRPKSTDSETDDSTVIAAPSEAEVVNATFLWRLAARRCEQAEQLDEAWRLHRLDFQAHKLTTTLEESRYYNLVLKQFWHYEWLASWVWHPQQTSAMLKPAIAELLADGANALPPEVLLPHEFQRFREGQESRSDTDRNVQGDWSWERRLFRRLCPAESQRERQVIDGLEAAHHAAFADLRSLTRDLSASWNQPPQDNSPPAIVVRTTWLIPSPPKLVGAGVPWVRGRAAELIARTPRLSHPQARPYSNANSYTDQQFAAVRQFLSTEGQRRALLLFMAERAFELDHQRPPNSSDELVPAYLPQRPATVLSGDDLFTRSRRPQVRTRFDGGAPTAVLPDATEPPAQRRLWPLREGAHQIRVEIPFASPPRLLVLR